MKFDDLFQVVSLDAGKPFPLAPDQFEFRVDLGKRRVAGGIFDLPDNRQTMRVQTNRVFVAKINATLPDTSIGMLRLIPCAFTLEGSIAANEAAARSALRAAAAVDFKIDALLSRTLEQAINRQREILQGTFVPRLRDKQHLTTIERSMMQFFCDAGIPLQRVAIMPLVSDTSGHVELEDRTGSLRVRSKGNLELNRLGFKAKLVWGREDAHVVGRLTYNGSILGTTAGEPLDNPIVAGQVQPVELWFRQLLAAALADEAWPDVIARDRDMMSRITTRISRDLGQGTGRVVDTLILNPIRGDRPALAEKSARFLLRYAITGLRDEGLEIEHTIQYAVADRDLWVTHGSLDPEDFLRKQTNEATKLLLTSLHFEDVVSLYLSERDGETSLSKNIEGKLAPLAGEIGLKVISVATILALPEMDFVNGRNLEFDEERYSLSDPHLAPPMSIRAEVKVHADSGLTFARALAQASKLEPRIRAAIADAVRNKLREYSALEYYASPFVNGAPTERQPKGPVATISTSSFQEGLHAHVQQELKHKFGLELSRFDLVPGDDALITRMKELSRLSLQRHINFSFNRGASDTQITLNASATIFITSIDQQNWQSFYFNAQRIPSVELHIDKFDELLLSTLNILEFQIVSQGLRTLESPEARRTIVDIFTQRMREELGLVAELRTLVLQVRRPRAGQSSASIELRGLTMELERAVRERAELQGGDTFDDIEERREKMTRRIDAVKRDIERASEEVESVIQETESVTMELDRSSGLLLPTQNAATTTP